MHTLISKQSYVQFKELSCGSIYIDVSIGRRLKVIPLDAWELLSVALKEIVQLQCTMISHLDQPKKPL